MVFSANLGFPRVGAHRELKKAVEDYWKGALTQDALLETAKGLRAKHWQLQQAAGLDVVPSNDFSLYDHVLDMIATVGAVPARYQLKPGAPVDLTTYFLMARGQAPVTDAQGQVSQVNGKAMEMTKWFDSNYHYLVPEFEPETKFSLSSTKIFDEFAEAKALGITTRPMLVGPVTFVLLGKGKHAGYSAEATLAALLPVYVEILTKLATLGAEWVQIDEPLLAMDLTPAQRALFTTAYTGLLAQSPVKIMLATYFDGLRDNAELTFSLPVAGVHIDVTRVQGKANTQVVNSADAVKQAVSLAAADGKVLSVGVVDGRNIWKNDLKTSLALVQLAVDALGPNRVQVAGSSSLLHTPVDLDNEHALPAELAAWLAFAKQKVAEIVTVAKGINHGPAAIVAELAASDAVVAARKVHPIAYNEQVRKRLGDVSDAMLLRPSPFAVRQQVQHNRFKLPLFPTTSIGSFPQTAAIRKARADFKAGKLDEAKYVELMHKEIDTVVQFQHDVDIDVLVHGEPERNDMVEYFGEQLSGFIFTSNGWVQSYGSRCVKPPIIVGDVSRPTPMTVAWSTYAQSKTQRPMKGMLTGPITILQWSFVRDDQPRSQTAKQIALAIRDEVADLEANGISMIQIDEAAIREGLPLRKADREAYLHWAVDAFRLTAAVAKDETQIHTHMCYSEFNDIIESVAKMDADVISIETSRSQMELLDAFVNFQYPNEIGPGVYDIHSPRVPTQEEMVALLAKAAKVIPVRNLWVNPDCGLKTRGWPEVEQAIKLMVAAAKQMRASQ